MAVSVGTMELKLSMAIMQVTTSGDNVVLSVAGMLVAISVAVMQLELSATLVQVTVSAANMWVKIFIVIMQMESLLQICRWYFLQ